MSPQPSSSVSEHLNTRFGTAPAEAVLAVALDRYHGRIALVSSFGAEAAVLLHMLSVIDRSVPVIMLDTQLLFPETLAYQSDLTERLGLQDVRIIHPDEAQDPARDLHRRDSQACCDLRKVAPLEQALDGFDATLTGRKRFQTKARSRLQTFELDPQERLKISPLAHWPPERINRYFGEHDLPRHPLVAQNYLSIGCAPCTSPVAKGEDARAGRWRDETREECGIHFRPDGTVERRAR